MNLEPIDTSTTAGKARVMQLAAEGRKVANRQCGIWLEDDHPAWNWDRADYGIIRADLAGRDE